MAGEAGGVPPMAPINTDGWTTILDNSSFWRISQSGGNILVKRNDQDDKIEEYPSAFKFSLPPGEWISPDFDDSGWGRQHFFPKWANGECDSRAGGGCQWVQLRQLSLRGKFTVTDPAAVKRLALNMVFRGGVVLYLNGKEVTRAFLPVGKLEPGAAARLYPKEVYVAPDGRYIHWYHNNKTAQDSYSLRLRKLTGVEIPAALLHKGTNVLGVEVHAAPHIVPAKIKIEKLPYGSPSWSTCGLVELHLQAENVAGLVPNVVRPAGIQVWNASPHESLHDIEYGDVHGKLRPVSIVAARNGAFSDRVVVSSDKPLRNFKARVSDLSTAAGKKLPASAIELGYGKFDVVPVPRWGGLTPDAVNLYPNLNVCREQGVLTAPPAEVAVRPIGASHYLAPAARDQDGLPPYVPGAIQSVWVIANVPKDAAVGDYQGTLTATTDGERPVAVPVRLEVCDWTLPDPADYACFMGMIESPEGVAQPYDFPLWSDKNWKYAARSLDYLGKIGNKVLYVMVGAESQYGNAEGMVRWIRGADGKFTYDFSRVEKYVDLALKKMGKPQFVVVGVWDSCMHCYAPADKKRKFPRFTVEDAKTHAVTTADGPPYGSPESLDFWKPVLTGVYGILNKRALGEAMLLGYSSDVVPDPQTVSILHTILPNVCWQSTNHPPNGPHNVKYDGGVVPVLYLANVWGGWDVPDPQQQRNYGWRYHVIGDDPRAVRTWLDRDFYDASNPSWFFNATERALLAGPGGLHGLGQIGADLWDRRDKNGNVSTLMVGRFPGTSEGNLGCYLAQLLYYGPDGPVPSVGFMMMRESIEECEARIFLERLLLDKKLPDALARKCQNLLDERTLAVRGFSAYGRRAQLFEAAGEAAKAAGAK
jgi:hypothetical protein